MLLLSRSLILASSASVEEHLDAQSLQEVRRIERVESHKYKEGNHAQPLGDRSQVEELLNSGNRGREGSRDEAEGAENECEDSEESLCFVARGDSVLADDALELRARKDCCHVHKGVNSGRHPEDNDNSLVDNRFLGVSTISITSVNDIGLEGDKSLNDSGKAGKNEESYGENVECTTLVIDLVGSVVTGDEGVKYHVVHRTADEK